VKKPPKIKHAYVDADLLIFPAASSAQTIEYYFVDPDGQEVGTFDSAKSAANWLEECEIMDCDVQFEYEGDFSKLERRDRLHIGEFEDAVKTYKKLLKRWLKESGAQSYTCYVSKKSGLENFRHRISLRKPYKGNRKGSAKPYYLEQLRQYILTLPHHKKAVGDFECDDVVCGMAQRKPSNVLIQAEKDGLQCVKCWVYFPDYHDEPVWSSPHTVGYVEMSGNKLMGLGHLFLLGQILTGDTADNYSGLDKCGAKGAHKLLSPFNNKNINSLDEAVEVVCQAYYDKYGEEYEYVDKDGEADTASWKDFLLESLNLAYMRKGRNDLIPEPYTSIINEWEPEE
jgi:hypothetical protein